MEWIARKTVSGTENLGASLSPITLQLLLQRGFDSKEKIQKFLNTRFEDLYNPQNLNGVFEAVEKIEKARKNSTKVAIFGDYDADGITSTILLKEALEQIGISPKTYIPDRNKEGYGLNKSALDYIKKEYGTELIITVDCGISNRSEIKYANKIGMEVIVIDHHAIPRQLPEKSILINPKLTGQKYPFSELAGVGVAFKFICALWEKIIPPKIPQLKWFLDIVAIGTIADCVPLIDENRIFAKFGLIVLQKTKRVGIQEIIKTARIPIDAKNPPNVENVSFQIGPRLNASGRMDHADLTLNLLIEKNRVTARMLALELESKNSERQKVTQEVFSEIKSTLREGEEYRLIIRKGRNWPLGILGVVAGKIAEEYHCPVFVLREGKDLLEGSGRSIEAFNLMEAVSGIDEILERYGGHSQAMGIKIRKKNLADFENKLLGIIDSSYDKKSWGKKLVYDLQIDPENIDWDILSEIRKFEPFGEGNREPVFFSKGFLLKELRMVGNGQKHAKIILGITGNSKEFDCIFFKGSEKFRDIKTGEKISAVYNIRSSRWNNNHKIELHIIDIKKDA